MQKVIKHSCCILLIGTLLGCVLFSICVAMAYFDLVKKLGDTILLTSLLIFIISVLTITEVYPKYLEIIFNNKYKVLRIVGRVIILAEGSVICILLFKMFLELNSL